MIDSANQQFQIIPKYGYRSANLNASIQFPLVYNHKDKLLFADISALSGLITDVQNDGKYSKFDLSKIPMRQGMDTQLVDWVRKSSTMMLTSAPASSYKDAELTAADRSLDAVRKVQFTLKPTDTFAHFPTLLNDLSKIIDPEQDSNDVFPESKMQEFKEEMLKNMSPDSHDVYSIAFNKAGQIVSMNADSNYTLLVPDESDDEEEIVEMPSRTAPMKKGKKGKHVYPSVTIEPPVKKAKEPKMTLNMRMSTDYTVTDIGRAQLINAPTAANSVDGKQNLENSLMGSMFGAFLGRSSHDDEPMFEENDATKAAAGAAVDATRAAGAAAAAAAVDAAASYPRTKPTRKSRKKSSH